MSTAVMFLCSSSVCRGFRVTRRKGSNISKRTTIRIAQRERLARQQLCDVKHVCPVGKIEDIQIIISMETGQRYLYLIHHNTLLFSLVVDKIEVLYQFDVVCTVHHIAMCI